MAPGPGALPAPPRSTRPRPKKSIGTKVALTAASLALAATGAIGGSYATWTASTVNPGQAVTAGLLTLENDKANRSLFAATNVRPGMSSSSSVVIANKAGANQLPMLATLSQQDVATTFSSSLRWTLHDQTRNWCYWPVNRAGACPDVLTSGGAWNASATVTDLKLRPIGGLPTDPWPAGESHTFVVEWALGADSPNADQGQSASFDLAWSGSQVPA